MARLIKSNGEIISGFKVNSVEDARKILESSVEFVTFSKQISNTRQAEFWAFIDADRTQKELPINEKATLVIEQEIRGSAIITSESEMLAKTYGY